MLAVTLKGGIVMARFNLAQLQSLFLLGSFGDWLLTRKLIERGFSNDQIEKILRGNWLRLFKEWL